MPVRVATVEDADDIAALAARTFPLACPDHTPAEAIEKHIRTELNADRFRDHMDTAQFLVVDAPGGGVRGYVMLLGDGVLGQMMEPIDLTPKPALTLPEKDWALTGSAGRGRRCKLWRTRHSAQRTRSQQRTRTAGEPTTALNAHRKPYNEYLT